MPSGPIILPPHIQHQCTSLANLGSMLQIYTIQNFVHVMDVHRRILTNTCTVSDLQDVVQLCRTLKNHPCIGEFMSTNIGCFQEMIEHIIHVVVSPMRPCGMNTMCGF